MEALVSLAVLSLIMFTLLSAVRIYQEADLQSRSDKSSEWLQFLHLMEEELSLYEIALVDGRRVRLKAPGENRHYEVILRNKKIYKTPGHHPYLYEVANWQVLYFEGGLYVWVKFANGQTFEGVVPVVEHGK